MACKLIWSPSARIDLQELIYFIAEQNPGSARRFGDKLFQTVERLSIFPESGRIVPEFGDPLIREIIRKPCRIVYRLDPEKLIVEIVRIWHSARGIPQI